MNTISPEIKDFLDEKALQYNSPAFIESDPICIPHSFYLKEDIEISGFLAATIAWGNRISIIKNARLLMDLMDNSPYDFIMNHDIGDLERFRGFVHRTFNFTDLTFFILSLKNIYANHGGLEAIFTNYCAEISTQPAIYEFGKIFFSIPHETRTHKHIAQSSKGISSKENQYVPEMDGPKR